MNGNGIIFPFFINMSTYNNNKYLFKDIEYIHICSLQIHTLHISNVKILQNLQ